MSVGGIKPSEIHTDHRGKNKWPAKHALRCYTTGYWAVVHAAAICQVGEWTPHGGGLMECKDKGVQSNGVHCNAARHGGIAEESREEHIAIGHLGHRGVNVIHGCKIWG